MVLLIDNYDSFTYLLRDYILQCGENCVILRNDEKSVAEILKFSFDSLVISAGPKTPESAGITMDLIDHLHNSKPILGVCLGHQALGIYFKMRLKKAALPMHGITSVIKANTHHFLFRNLESQQTVMRYHSLILEKNESKEMEVIAQTSSGEIMAIAHQSLPLAGLQFHPESIGTPSGLLMLKNWFAHIKTI